MRKILTAIPRLGETLSRDGHRDAAKGILTTDTRPKEAAVVRDGYAVGGMAKGCGMLAPNMATMLAFLTTDAELSPDELKPILFRAADATFNALITDGATSTNDTVMLFASGRKGRPADLAQFEDDVRQVCEELMLQMARDAEGMTKLVVVRVTGAASDAEARKVARSIGNNQLIKCSWYGADAYWGRLLAEAGSCGVEFDTERSSGQLRRDQGCRGGRRNPARCRGGARPYEGRGDRHPGRPRPRHRHGPRRLGRPRPRLHQGKCGDVMINTNDTARLLIEALPYIRRFTGKTIVVKVGGLPMTDPDRGCAASPRTCCCSTRSAFARCWSMAADRRSMNRWRGRARRSKRIDGLRVTDAEALDIVRMVLVGKINRELVSAVNALEPVAVGVAGEDGRLLEATQIDARLGFVGRVGNVRAGLLHALLDDGLVPIVSTVGADRTGQPYNVNADDAARAIAVAMGAEKIIYLTGAPGLLEDPARPDSLIHRLTAAEARHRIADESVTGGMIPKLLACAEAVEGGVGSAHMIDGRAEHAILVELFTDEGVGTMVCGETG